MHTVYPLVKLASRSRQNGVVISQRQAICNNQAAKTKQQILYQEHTVYLAGQQGAGVSC